MELIDGRPLDRPVDQTRKVLALCCTQRSLIAAAQLLCLHSFISNKARTAPPALIHADGPYFRSGPGSGCGNRCGDCPSRPSCTSGRPKSGCCWESKGPKPGDGYCCNPEDDDDDNHCERPVAARAARLHAPSPVAQAKTGQRRLTSERQQPGSFNRAWLAGGRLCTEFAGQQHPCPPVSWHF